MPELHDLVWVSVVDEHLLPNVGYLTLLWVPPPQVLVQDVHERHEPQLHTEINNVVQYLIWYLWSRVHYSNLL